MSVFRKRNGKWAVQVYDVSTGRMRQVGTALTRRDALVLETSVLERRTATGRESVESFAGRWARDYPRPSESTNVHNEERVRAFAKGFGGRRIDSITVDEARAWVLEHRSQLAGLRAMFNDARRSGLIRANPFAELGLPQSRGRRDLPGEWLTAQDINHLADSAGVLGGYAPIMATMIRVAAYTGMRPGELYALEFEDLQGDTILVRRSADSRTRRVKCPKNGRARTITYPGVARIAVDGMPRLHDRLVFPGPRGGQLWGSSFSWLWRPVKAAAGRPEMDFYELRHFCATFLLELGLPPADVAVQLGHTDGGALVMSTYGHPAERAARSRILTAMDGHGSGEIAEFRRRHG